MAKELPYFKFDVAEWINGSITLESDSAQGLFINICAHYWFKSGKLPLCEIKRRLFKSKPEDFQSLIDQGIIKVEKDMVSIAFLDEQLNERSKLSETNSANGRLGGRPKSETKPTAFKSKSETKANKSNIEEKRREENTLTALCLVFGKQYKQPKDRMPNEVQFYRDIDNQYDILTLRESDQAVCKQVQAYIKHCDQTGRKRIATAHKLAETIDSCDWLVLNGNGSTKAKDPYEEARYNKTLLSTEAWREKYSDKIAFDKNFQKAFGYEKL